MEIQLQELIEQIKKEGVEAAEAQAAAKLDAANKEADDIIANAKAEAERILKQAKDENERLVRVSEDAIRQAGRNLLISFRESVNKELNAIIGENVKAIYSSDALKELIVKAVENWAKTSEADTLSLLLGSDDLKKLESELIALFKEKMLTGITIGANDNFDGGFGIAVDNGRIYYDYSAQSVIEMLSVYLNPRITALMKEAENQ